MTAPSAEGGALRSQSLRRPAGEPILLNGTILRVDRATGLGLPDNPMANHPDLNARRIIAYGLRNPFRIAYGTSKGALIAFTKYVATAYGKQNVPCNNVAPSVVFTPAARRNLTPESFAIYENAHCLPRLSEPRTVPGSG